MKSVRTISDAEVLKAIDKHGSERLAAKKLGVAKSTFNDWAKAARANEFSTKQMKKPIKIKKPRHSSVKRFIFTSAQDGTALFTEFFDNLEAYADYLDAEIVIAGFTYGKSLFEEHAKNKAAFTPRVEPYMTHRRFDVGDGLVFCGEMNTLPTAVNPLSGFETYTRRKWGIFPHAKVQLQSVATMKSEPAKIIMTTGAVTKPNYVMKKAGIKATFHHVYGAVLVELLPDGTFFCRHLLGENDTGNFYDLDRYVKNGKVTKGHRIEAINWGDIHWEKLDEQVARTSFGYSRINNANIKGKDNLLDYLKPRHQFMHDLSDFEPRNHHNIKDHHFLFETHVRGKANVEEALRGSSNFLEATSRPWCQTVVVESNHDTAFHRWLKNADYTEDPENAIFFLKSQLKCYQAIADGDPNYNIFEDVLREFSAHELIDIVFLREDDSYIICPEHGGIESGMHGHLGANGARGAPRQFTKMGPKANIGHTHSAFILDGIVGAGVSGELDMRYNRGLSSWTHTHTMTYANGKRALLTMMGGKFYA